MPIDLTDSAKFRSYEEIIAAKERYAVAVGFDEPVTDPWLFGFQRRMVEWALAGGRRAVFADTGLGKSRVQLRWADAVQRRTGGRVLILAPLAVGPQTVQESNVVGIDGVTFARRPEDSGSARIVVTNYDNLDKWDSTEVSGVVLDESAILKNFMGATKRHLCERFNRTPFRLCCSATPAPNDHLELGNHADFLGILSSHQMIARWFINDGGEAGKYRLKGHAVASFWDWVASWAVCCGKPSDVAPEFFDEDSRYILPPIHLHKHVVNVDLTVGRKDGALFRMGELSATTIHQEKRLTTTERAAKVAEIMSAEPNEHWLIWCETDYESEAIRAVVSGMVEVSGSMPSDTKADRLLAFANNGGRLLTKPKIGGAGLNLQICARMLFSGGSYSYESFYQSIRRCWRFGQSRDVHVHVVLAYTEQAMWSVISGRSQDHEGMKVEMFAASRRAQSRHSAMLDYHPTHSGRLPTWLKSTHLEPTE